MVYAYKDVSNLTIVYAYVPHTFAVQFCRFSFFYQKILGGEGISPLGAFLIRVCVLSEIKTEMSCGAKSFIFYGFSQSSS